VPLSNGDIRILSLIVAPAVVVWWIPRGISDFGSTCRLSGKEDFMTGYDK
jgi:hypothetical protein